MKSCLVAFAATTLGLFFVVWGIIHFAFARIEPLEYQFTRAHNDFLSKCEIGDIVILGDSTAVADFIPSRIGRKVFAYSMAGGTPVENYFVARAISGCPLKPKAVILSFTAASFRPLPTFPVPPGTYFWIRGVEEGVVNFSDALQVLKYSRELNDRSITGPPTAFDADFKIRALLSSIEFPPYLFSELRSYLVRETNPFRSHDQSPTTYAYIQTKLDMGHHFFGMRAEGVGGYDFDALRSQEHNSPLSKFQISPLSDLYLRRTIEMFRNDGVKVYFVEPPRSRTAYVDYSTDLVDDYQQYLLAVSRAEPNAALLDPGFHVWNTALFGDLAHLNLRGANAYSDEIRRAMIAVGDGDLVFSDGEIGTHNLYDITSRATEGLVGADRYSTISLANDVSLPKLRYQSASPVWLDEVQNTDTAIARNARIGPALPLDANNFYAVSVFVKNVDAGNASLRLSWPGGTEGSVTWDFNQRQINYTGTVNLLNSGVTLCPGGWTQLFLSATTGAKSISYSGPVVSLSAKHGASAYFYSPMLERGLWPTNYCTLQPDETQIVAFPQTGGIHLPAKVSSSPISR